MRFFCIDSMLYVLVACLLRTMGYASESTRRSSFGDSLLATLHLVVLQVQRQCASSILLTLLEHGLPQILVKAKVESSRDWLIALSKLQSLMALLVCTGGYFFRIWWQIKWHSLYLWMVMFWCAPGIPVAKQISYITIEYNESIKIMLLFELFKLLI